MPVRPGKGILISKRYSGPGKTTGVTVDDYVDLGEDSDVVICKRCGDEHLLSERNHVNESTSFCPRCNMRGGYVLDEYRDEFELPGEGND